MLNAVYVLCILQCPSGIKEKVRGKLSENDKMLIARELEFNSFCSTFISQSLSILLDTVVFFFSFSMVKTIDLFLFFTQKNDCGYSGTETEA